MSSTTDTDLADVLTYASIGFGATALLAPRVFERLYGLEDGPALRVMVRLFGSRNLALSAVYLATDDADAKRDLLGICAVLNVVDALGIAGAGSGVKASSRILGALTTTAFAAGYVAARGRA